MDTSLIAALSALGGAIIGALATALNTMVVQRFESRRRLRENLLIAAEKSWREHSEQIVRANKKLDADQQMFSLTLSDFIIIALKFENEFHSLKSLDDDTLKKLADTLDATFAQLAGQRLQRVRQNRSTVSRYLHGDG